MKKTIIASALLFATGASHAAVTNVASTVFEMYDGTGSLIHTDATVTGWYDVTAATWGVSSTTTFYSLVWTASNGVLYGAGTHTVSLDDSGSGGVGTAAQTATFSVGSGQIGGHIKFAWGTTTGMDVIVIWNADGSMADVEGDGIPGWAMQDGPFMGFSANFSMSEQPTVVPLPAAVWLFGFGMAGLLGLARRRGKC